MDYWRSVCILLTDNLEKQQMIIVISSNFSILENINVEFFNGKGKVGEYYIIPPPINVEGKKVSYIFINSNESIIIKILKRFKINDAILLLFDDQCPEDLLNKIKKITKSNCVINMLSNTSLGFIDDGKFKLDMSIEVFTSRVLTLSYQNCKK